MFCTAENTNVSEKKHKKQKKHKKNIKYKKILKKTQKRRLGHAPSCQTCYFVSGCNEYVMQYGAAGRRFSQPILIAGILYRNMSI